MPLKDPDAWREYQREWKKQAHAKDPEKYRKANRDSYQANRNQRLADMAEYREGRREELAAAEQARRDALTAEQKQEGWLKRRYGMSLADYTRLVEAQDGRCAICGKPQDLTSWRTRLVVDHCHDTGIVRGILCTNCNKGIGMFADSPETMRAAIEYLLRFSASREASA